MRQAAWEEFFKAGQPPAEEPRREKRPWERFTSFSWEDAVTMVLVLIVFLTVVQSIEGADWVAEMPSLYAPAFVGLMLGFFLAKTRVPEAVAHFIGLLAGAGAVLYFAPGRLEGSLSTRTDELIERMRIWIEALASGGISNDNLPFVVMIVALTYVTAYISSWSLFRWHNAWVGMIPAGIALLTNISYLPGQNSVSLIIFLFCAVILVARMHVLRRAREWRKDGTPYPDLISLYVLNITVWVAIVLLAAAWILPVGRSGGILVSAWESITSPVVGPLNDFGRLFAAIDSKRGGSIHKFGSTLPLQGEINLGSGEVLQAVAAEPGFLRAQTYDFYSAQGWRVSGNVQITSGVWPALRALQSPDEARRQFRRPLSVQVTLMKRSGVIVTTGQPLAVDIESRVVFGPDPSDIASLRPVGRLNEGDKYRTEGSVSSASQARLRSAGTNYPSWTQTYLQLPAGLPPTIAEKAREVTRGATNAFDRATAIEQFLRSYGIDTKIKAAPANRDSVEYFLFELRRGYFDYHASAMVVMLRTLGIPARLATGYIIRPTDRLPDTSTYVIREANAFSWPEVFFPGLGWVEFNPTPSEPPIARPGTDDQQLAAGDEDVNIDELFDADQFFPDVDAASGSLDSLVVDEESRLIGNIILGIIVAFLAISFAGVAFFQFSWQHGLAGLPLPVQIWEKTLRLAGWARVGVSPEETPMEYARRLESQLPEAEDVSYLADAFLRSRYGHKELKEEEVERLRTAWKGVRNGLFARLFRWK
jgi:transglutaminase-like putative cysteine protease